MFVWIEIKDFWEWMLVGAGVREVGCFEDFRFMIMEIGAVEGIELDRGDIDVHVAVFDEGLVVESADFVEFPRLVGVVIEGDFGLEFVACFYLLGAFVGELGDEGFEVFQYFGWGSGVGLVEGFEVLGVDLDECLGVLFRVFDVAGLEYGGGALRGDGGEVFVFGLCPCLVPKGFLLVFEVLFGFSRRPQVGFLLGGDGGSCNEAFEKIGVLPDLPCDAVPGVFYGGGGDFLGLAVDFLL